MASSYPGALDSFTNPTSTDAMDASAALYHDVQHANINDAVEAIEGELGTDPAGAFPTVGARVQAAQPLAGYRDVRELLVGPEFFSVPAISASVALATGYAYYARWHCPASFTATKLWWFQYSLAATVTLAEIGIYSSAGSRLQRATISSVVTSEGIKSATITGQSLTAGSVYYIGFFINASTVGSLGGASVLNFSKEYLGASSSDRLAYSQSGQSELPASVTFSGLTLINTFPGFGVSA